MTVATDTEVKLDEKIEKVIHDPGKYHVIFLNDNQTPMEFVVEMLTQIFKHSQDTAQKITLDIHENGSGIAGTFMEWAMKTTKSTDSTDVLHTWEPTMWTKNIALAFFGVVGSSIAMLTKDRTKILEYGVFNDFKTSLLIAIILQAAGGLLVGAVLKYADNIIKGFVTSVGVIFASLASVYLFNFVITTTFVIGAIIVFTSLHVYNSKRNYLLEYGLITSDSIAPSQ